MSNEIQRAKSNSTLKTLSVEISEHHAQAVRARREFVEHAIAAGERLISAKAQVAHGEWKSWLAANLPDVSERTVQRYMRAARNAAKNDTVSDFTTLRELIAPKQKENETTETRAVNDIIIGNRFRKDLGDLGILAESIARCGMLQPIIINDDNTLVCGQRRLVACRDILGMTEIPVRVANIDPILGEYHENVLRLRYSPQEAVQVSEEARP